MGIYSLIYSCYSMLEFNYMSLCSRDFSNAASFIFFFHLKAVLLSQLPASKAWKILLNMRLKSDLYANMCIKLCENITTSVNYVVE